MIPDEADAHLFKALEEQLLQPEVRTCARALDRLLHDAFVEFGRSGRTYTKQEAIVALLGEGSPSTTVAIGGLHMRHLAPEVVQVTYTSAQRAPDGSEGRRTLRSSIWVWCDSCWRLIFHQGTPTTSGHVH